LKILLTGALGFFGSNFLLKFRNELNITIDLIVRDSISLSKNYKYSNYKIFSSKDLDNIIFNQYDFIVHAATNYSNKDIYHDNVIFPLNIITKIRSSDCIFINMDSFFNHHLNKSNYLKSYTETKKNFFGKFI
jgi:nucleoside-diphosphate-sugar epimerase